MAAAIPSSHSNHNPAELGSWFWEPHLQRRHFPEGQKSSVPKFAKYFFHHPILLHLKEDGTVLESTASPPYFLFLILLNRYCKGQLEHHFGSCFFIFLSVESPFHQNLGSTYLNYLSLSLSYIYLYIYIYLSLSA